MTIGYEGWWPHTLCCVPDIPQGSNVWVVCCLSHCGTQVCSPCWLTPSLGDWLVLTNSVSLVTHSLSHWLLSKANPANVTSLPLTEPELGQGDKGGRLMERWGKRVGGRKPEHLLDTDVSGSLWPVPCGRAHVVSCRSAAERESRATAGGCLSPPIACKTRTHLGRPQRDATLSLAAMWGWSAAAAWQLHSDATC